MPTNTQKIATLEAWTKAHDTAHKANPLHAATHSHPDLEADIDETNQALSAHILDVPPPVDPPPPPPPPPTGKVIPFPANGTQAALRALMADESIDVIEMAGGGRNWADFYVGVRRTRPLIVRPEGTVLFDGGGTTSPAFRFGWATAAQPTNYAANILFDAMGLGGRYEFANYRIGLAGLVMARAWDRCGFNDFDVHDVSGSTLPQHAHVVYLDKQEGLGQRSPFWQSNRVKIVGPANRHLSGLHIYHEPAPDHIEATDWTVENLHRWVYAANSLTDLLVARWVGKNCTATIDNAPNKATGIVKDCRATNCGTLAPGKGYWLAGPLLDGGGNSSS